MIVTERNGRKRSVLKADEVMNMYSSSYESLTLEEKAAFYALEKEVRDDRKDIQDIFDENVYHTRPVSMAEFIENPYYLGASCTTLYPALKQDLIDLFEHPYREVVLTGGIGVGKCVSGDTEIYDPINGMRYTAQQMSLIGGVGCASYDHGGRGMVSASAMANESGYKKVGDLILGSGKKVRVSLDHPILTPYGWKEARELKPGDLVATARRMPHPVNPLAVSDDEVKWVAYMLTDGGTTDGSMSFTNDINSIHMEFEKCTIALGGGSSDRRGCSFVRMDGKAKTVRPLATGWLRKKYRLWSRAADKRVPAEFYGLDNRQLGIFLNRLWSCDGWVSRRSKSNWEAGIALGSERFVRDIQQLLLRAGVHSRVRCRRVKYAHKGEHKESNAWALHILGKDNVVSFLNFVGMIKGKESRCILALEQTSSIISNSNIDITPVDRSVMTRIRKEIGPFPKKAYWPRPAQGSQMGNKVFRVFSANYRLPSWCRWWGDVFWDKVDSFFNLGVMEQVYDLEVPGTANFAPSGIIIHNTFSLSIAICRILYELSCMISPQETFGLSKGTEMTIPMISKNLVLAREIMKSAVDDKIKESPYFMTKFTPDVKKEHTLFPNNIRITIGSYGSDRILGSNVFTSAMDECLTKKQIVTVENDGVVYHETVENLIEMGQSGFACKMVCFDHDTRSVRGGWWRIKESNVQPIVRVSVGAESLDVSSKHPILVLRGDLLIYVHAEDVVPKDTVVMEVNGHVGTLSCERAQDDPRIEQQSDLKRDECTVRDSGFRGRVRGGESQQGGIDGMSLGGVRREWMRASDLPSELKFATVSSVTHLQPEQTYSICTEFQTFFAGGMVVHNTNFPPKRKAQQIATGFGQKLKAAHFDIVEKMYRSMVRRIKSRFQKAGGGFPGMVILASSAATVESFTERKIAESVNDSDVFVRDHTQWTAKPQESFCGEVFYILCSRSAMKSKILEESEYDMITDEFLDANEAFIMDIPVEFKADFEANMEESLRDIAGFSTEAISQFMQRPKAIEECTDSEREHPFSVEEWVCGSKAKFHWPKMVLKFQRKLPGGFTEEAFAPRRNPKALRWCHMDTSVSGDSTGICIAHIDRWVEVVRRDPEMNVTAEVAPYYIVDFMLRVNPPAAEQIYMPDLRTILYQFQKKGFRFAGFSTDTYQYVEMHQQVRRKGVTPHIISMDTSTDQYDELKSAFYENRIEIYYYKPFIEELKKLEYDRVAGKIDHPLAGSKDVSDSVAGAIWGLKKSAARTPLHGSIGKAKMSVHEHSWVSTMIPSENIDIEAVKEAKEAASTEMYMPILFDGD